MLQSIRQVSIAAFAYGAWLFEQHTGAYRCVIGAMTAQHLARIGVPFLTAIYQPQGTRGVPVANHDRGWQELLAAVNER